MDSPIETYKVIFSGSTLNGHTLEEVKARFAQAFKLHDESVIHQLFSGKVVILKRNLTYDAARRYSRILNKLGADCCLECEHNPLINDAEPDQDYERKKRRRMAQFDHKNFAEIGLTPK